MGGCILIRHFITFYPIEMTAIFLDRILQGPINGVAERQAEQNHVVIILDFHKASLFILNVSE